jgi:transcriptional regulator
VSPATPLLQGTLDVLILKSLSLGPMHGLGIARRVEQLTGGTFQVGAGSLFPALHRLAEAGWLIPQWGQSESNRRARYYRLSRAGEKELRARTAEWSRVSRAISMALETR